VVELSIGGGTARVRWRRCDVAEELGFRRWRCGSVQAAFK
jgi:hypothetical protein